MNVFSLKLYFFEELLCKALYQQLLTHIFDDYGVLGIDQQNNIEQAFDQKHTVQAQHAILSK